jgi:hypothetical protein
MFVFVHPAPGTWHGANGVSLMIFGVNECKCETAMSDLIRPQEVHPNSCIVSNTSNPGNLDEGNFIKIVLRGSKNGEKHGELGNEGVPEDQK